MVPGMLDRQWPYFLALVYLPALCLVLRPAGLRMPRGAPHRTQHDRLWAVVLRDQETGNHG